MSADSNTIKINGENYTPQDIPALVQRIGDLEKRAIFHVKKMLYNMRYLGLKRAILICNPKAPQVSEAFENQVKSVYGPSSMVPTFNDVSDAENYLNR